MLVMGVDPGSVTTGYGLVTGTENNLEYLACGGIKTKARDDFHSRLKRIYDELTRLIAQYNPDQIIFEDIFFGKNVKAALHLGHARGAAIIAAMNAEKIISFYSPREVKQALTGNGGASKEQVQKMVQFLLHLQTPVTPLDASDALAIAICHINRYNTSIKINRMK